MGLLDVFRSEKKASAEVAKERLQVVVAQRRAETSGQPAYFPDLQRDLLAVIRKYVDVDDDAVNMDLDQHGDLDVLELNIKLGDDTG
ncbi:cell division topological specificity factor MinE [Salinisphaera sp. USBA-960]|uniref:cell division topological specificity factor MinE n=1 Tax=Salinisphaera orenii TaxID=856731 RepID=UPI000DBE4B10|nr:cell division topological specificity factor MinE [Salifodinibacter halophilus]NNC26478.1 cell division topological specificity factor MinE [Salifodinibacter halophilus]